MIKTHFLLPVIAIMLITTACSKNSNDNNTSKSVFSTYSSLDTIYQMLALQPKVVTIDALTGGSFTGNSGTVYTFKPACFQDAYGTGITGNVQIAVTEYLKQGDMVFAKLLPISDDQQLQSAGEINVVATQAGQEVFLRPGFTFEADIPQGKKADGGMSAFIGRPYTQGAFSNVAAINWGTRNPDSTIAYAIIKGTDTVSVFCDSMHYWNGDHYLAGIVTTTSNSLTLTTAANVGASSLQVRSFLLVDNTRDIWPIYGNGNPISGFLTINQPCHIVAFTLINNRFYAGATAIKPNTAAGATNSYTVFLSETDPNAFKNQLNSLY